MQRSDFEFIEYCKTRSEINFWYESPSVEVVYACYVTEKIVQLTLRSKRDNIKPSRRNHIVNGALTCAFGRCELDKAMSVLLKEPSTEILYCDTDSVGEPFNTGYLTSLKMKINCWLLVAAGVKLF